MSKSLRKQSELRKARYQSQQEVKNKDLIKTEGEDGLGGIDAIPALKSTSTDTLQVSVAGSKIPCKSTQELMPPPPQKRTTKSKISQIAIFNNEIYTEVRQSTHTRPVDSSNLLTSDLRSNSSTVDDEDTISIVSLNSSSTSTTRTKKESRFVSDVCKDKCSYFKTDIIDRISEILAMHLSSRDFNAPRFSHDINYLRAKSVDRDRHYIQIVFDDKQNSKQFPKYNKNDVGHWIVLYFNATDFKLYILDSFNEDIEKKMDFKVLQLCLRLFPFEGLQYFNCIGKQQSNQFDCGPFACAFAISLAMGLNPLDIIKTNFSDVKLRKTVSNICYSEVLEAFFTLKAKMKTKSQIGNAINLFSDENTLYLPPQKPDEFEDLTTQSNEIDPQQISEVLIDLSSSSNQIFVDEHHLHNHVVSNNYDPGDASRSAQFVDFTEYYHIQRNPNLADSYSEILNPHHYLTDTEINRFNILLGQKYNFSPQPVAFAHCPKFVHSRETSNHGQILLSGQYKAGAVGHYISIYFDHGSNVVELYDSLSKFDEIEGIHLVEPKFKDYLKNLFPTIDIIRFVKVQQQTNGYDCGCFAIANLIARKHNQPLHSLNIPSMHLRPYIKHVLESRDLITFIQYMNTIVNRNVLSSNVVEILDETVPMEVVEESTLTTEQQAKKDKRRQYKTEWQRKKRVSTNSVNKSEILKKQNKRDSDNLSNMSPSEKDIHNSKTKDAMKKHRAKAVPKEFESFLQMPVDDNLPKYHCGKITDEECEKCSANCFTKELNASKIYMRCCNGQRLNGDFHKSKVDYPKILKNLFTGKSSKSIHFLTHARDYNCSFAFASIRCIEDNLGQGVPIFKVQGAIYHNTSTIQVADDDKKGKKPKFAQIYFLDSDESAKCRLGNFDIIKLDKDILLDVDREIRAINPYAKSYIAASEIVKKEQILADKQKRDIEPVFMWIVPPTESALEKTKNVASAISEIAICFKSDGDGMVPKDLKALKIYQRTHIPNQYVDFALNEVSGHCDPMTYPLLFPSGQWGFHVDNQKKHRSEIKDIEAKRNELENRLKANQVSDAEYILERALLNQRQKLTESTNCSILKFYQNRLQVRPNEYNPCLMGGKLTQQYIVDVYVRIETERLNFFRGQSFRLRIDRYKGLCDYVQSKADRKGINAGKILILPSSHIGSPRSLVQLYQDAMAQASHVGKPPTLFVTMTCNPNWPEIKDSLEPNQYPHNRPDIISRVFRLKQKQLLDDITVKKVFGDVLCWTWTIEFQKRGLPHMHLIVTLVNNINDPLIIDTYVSAEIPDETGQPILYSLVQQQMMHGPCGIQNPKNVCMNQETNKCRKNFPRDFQEETTILNKVPYYKRPDNKRNICVKNANNTKIIKELDNRWVVPHNPALLLRYQCHINVEICTGNGMIKYIHKYIFKGHDQAIIRIGKKNTADGPKAKDSLDWDEIECYVATRYVSAMEATWRIFEFPMHAQSHIVFRLPVHLENWHNVTYTLGDEDLVVGKDEDKVTELTAWFDYNRLHPGDACNKIFYQDFPFKYRFIAKQGYKLRAYEKQNLVTRIYNYTPKEKERYFLKILLLKIPGATCFQDMRTINGTVYDTYEEAAVALGICSSNDEWDKALAEASETQTPKALRQLFTSILLYCKPVVNALDLYNKYKEKFYEGFMKFHKCNPETAELYALRHIEWILNQSSSSILEELSMVVPDFSVLNLGRVQMYLPDDFDLVKETDVATRNKIALIPDQLEIFDLIMNAIYTDPTSDSQNLFFLQAPGGTGKSFLLNTIISNLWIDNKNVLATAWTGIAASILKGGQTCHNAFGLPFKSNETSVSRYTCQSTQAQRIRDSSLIIFDEATMVNSASLDTIERSVRDNVYNTLPKLKPKPFGGKIVLLCGDWRQTLPILKDATRAQIVENTLLHNQFWHSFNHLTLTQNLRVNQQDRDFAKWLLSIGTNKENKKYVVLPRKYILENAQNLVESIYTDNKLTVAQIKSFSDRVVLCTTNEQCVKINDEVLAKIDSEERTYFSEDIAVKADDDFDYLQIAPETLYRINGCALPLHELKLKIGALVMLNKNLNTNEGLCNGTRLYVSGLYNTYIECTKIYGCNAGEKVCIPRVWNDSDEEIFVLKRKQFPLKLAFAMTINKAQGLSFNHVGINLTEPVFSHGQLYVALSRITNKENLKIKVLNAGKPSETYKAYNVVYPEIIRDSKTV